jgi:hypothetical protein
MKHFFSAPGALFRDKMINGGRDTLWVAVEWLAMPLLILYPQLAILKWYRYGA